jgi:hypothetical protein
MPLLNAALCWVLSRAARAGFLPPTGLAGQIRRQIVAILARPLATMATNGFLDGFRRLPPPHDFNVSRDLRLGRVSVFGLLGGSRLVADMDCWINRP